MTTARPGRQGDDIDALINILAPARDLETDWRGFLLELVAVSQIVLGMRDRGPTWSDMFRNLERIRDAAETLKQLRTGMDRFEQNLLRGYVENDHKAPFLSEADIQTRGTMLMQGQAFEELLLPGLNDDFVRPPSFHDILEALSAQADALIKGLEVAGFRGRPGQLRPKEVFHGSPKDWLVDSAMKAFEFAHGPGVATAHPEGHFSIFVHAFFEATTGREPAEGESLARSIRKIVDQRRHRSASDITQLHENGSIA